MVVNKRRKTSRFRGSHTHGWGSKKKHRGSGHRGGKGMAGTGKRADQKKPSIWKERYFGKRGFKKKGLILNINPINLIDIELHLNSYIDRKLITKKDGFFEVKLVDLGYNKLLSTGKVKNKYRITTLYASAKAVEKVKQAGGEVIIQNTEG